MTTDPVFTLRLARDDRDLQAAMRLRYAVFVEELGGDGALVDHDARLEQDEFDPYFDHLLLIDETRDAKALEDVVGVYRLFPGHRAAEFGRFYSEAEYDLEPLRKSGRKLLELGRSCVHPAYRGTAAMFLLWNGLADYVLQNQIELLFGVASFHGTDAQALAEPLAYLYHNHLAPPDLCPVARPGHRQDMNLLPATEIDRRRAMQATPALIKAYLRLGGMVGDGAWIDHQFNTTDVCLVVDTSRMSVRHRDFYTRKAEG